LVGTKQYGHYSHGTKFGVNCSVSSIFVDVRTNDSVNSCSVSESTILSVVTSVLIFVDARKFADSLDADLG
jgi:hypothetical protein